MRDIRFYWAPRICDCNASGRKKKDSHLSPVQTTVNVNCNLRSRCLYIATPAAKCYIIFIPNTSTI